MDFVVVVLSMCILDSGPKGLRAESPAWLPRDPPSKKSRRRPDLVVKTLLLCSAVLPNARGKRQGQERREKARAEYDAPPCAHRGFASRPKVSALYLFPCRRRWDLLGLTSTSGGYRPANFHLMILDFRPSIFEGNEGGRMRVRSMTWWGNSRTRVTSRTG